MMCTPSLTMFLTFSYFSQSPSVLFFLFDLLLFIIILSELIFTSTSFYSTLLFIHFQRGYAWLFVIVLASCHFVLHTISCCIVFFTLYTTIVGDISLKLFNHRYTFHVSFLHFFLFLGWNFLFFFLFGNYKFVLM